MKFIYLKMEMLSLYEMEVSPTDIFSLMRKNIHNYYKTECLSSIDKNFLILRRSLISMISKISYKMGFKSQTYFLAVYYLDLIFSKENNFKSDYGIIALACLVTASKYTENLPCRPIFRFFISLYNSNLTDNDSKITKDDLFKYEILICKLLEYKLNYYSIYDFNFFFFGNGVIKIEQLKEINDDMKKKIDFDNSANIKKILIKIYEKSRFYLNMIINNLICLKYNSLFISIHIMEKSIEQVLINECPNIDYYKQQKIHQNSRKYFREIMKDFYKINYETFNEYKDLVIECENLNIFKSNNDNIRSEIEPTINKLNLKENRFINSNNSMTNVNKRDNLSMSKNNYLYKKVNVLKSSKSKMRKCDSISVKNNKLKNGIVSSSPKNNECINIKLRNKNITHLATNNNLMSYVKNINNINKKYSNVNNTTTANAPIVSYNTIKKSNTSSSPFNKSYSNNLYNKKKASAEKDNESNKLYHKKLVQNYDKEKMITNKVNNNKNITINININNKILYEGNKNSTQLNRSSARNLDYNGKIILKNKNSFVNDKKKNWGALYTRKESGNFISNMKENENSFEKNDEDLSSNFKRNKKNYDLNESNVSFYQNINNQNFFHFPDLSCSTNFDNSNNKINNSNNHKFNSNYNIYSSSNSTRNTWNNFNNSNYNNNDNNNNIESSILLPKEKTIKKKYKKILTKDDKENQSKLVKLLRNMRNTYNKINNNFNNHLSYALFNKEKEDSDYLVIDSSPARFNIKGKKENSDYRMLRNNGSYCNYVDNCITSFNESSRSNNIDDKKKAKTKIKVERYYGNSLNGTYKQ